MNYSCSISTKIASQPCDGTMPNKPTQTHNAFSDTGNRPRKPHATAVLGF